MSSHNTRYLQISITADQGASLPGLDLLKSLESLEFLVSLERSERGIRCLVSIDYDHPKRLKQHYSAMEIIKIIEQKGKNAVCEVYLTGTIAKFFAMKNEVWWVSPTHTNPNGMILTVRGTTRALRGLRKELEGVLIHGYKMKLGSETQYKPQFSNLLPDRQTVVLSTAIKMGYYHRPRQCTQREIADALDVKQATVSEHLQSAESAIIHRYASEI